MITIKEKRFIRYWEEQRKGGRRTYLILYAIAGTLIIGLLTFVVILLGFGLFLQPYMLWLVPASSLAIALIISSLTWNINEERFKRIIQREINDGKSQI